MSHRVQGSGVQIAQGEELMSTGHTGYRAQEYVLHMTLGSGVCDAQAAEMRSLGVCVADSAELRSKCHTWHWYCFSCVLAGVANYLIGWLVYLHTGPVAGEFQLEKPWLYMYIRVYLTTSLLNPPTTSAIWPHHSVQHTVHAVHAAQLLIIIKKLKKKCTCRWLQCSMTIPC